jgi:hypothetical protein
VVGYLFSHADDGAWVYWKENNQIIHWSPVVNERDTPFEFDEHLDLARDVVEGEVDLQGSTYRVLGHGYSGPW